MASSTDAGPAESLAQKLAAEHKAEPHAATVEDVPDEDLPQASSAPKKSNIDTQSHDAFPELGVGKGKSANVAPIWGAKASNGANGSSTAASRSSTPASAAPAPSQAAKPAFSIPGRNVESITLEPQYLLQRGQLKRPIPDIIKDINRKSRANVTMTTASNGRLKFDAAGPPDVAQQALKDLINQIGTKVSLPTIEDGIPRLTASDHHPGPDPPVCSRSHHRSRRFDDQANPGEDGCPSPASQG